MTTLVLTLTRLSSASPFLVSLGVAWLLGPHLSKHTDPQPQPPLVPTLCFAPSTSNRPQQPGRALTIYFCFSQMIPPREERSRDPSLALEAQWKGEGTQVCGEQPIFDIQSIRMVV